MPELPEVETTVRQLRPALLGRRIRGADVRWRRTLGGQSPAELAQAVRGTRILKVWRRAKYIVLELGRRRNPAGALLCHLRMTGRLYLASSDIESAQHVRVTLSLDRGSLVFLDVRKFGRLFYCADPASYFASLGPEPLSDDFVVADLGQRLRAHHRRLKPLLLDQTFLAGLGNIYADESLHRAGLHPLAYADQLSVAAVERLYSAIRSILTEAVQREGASFDRFYRTPAGQPGSYQDQFQVYGRKNQACPSCTHPIRRVLVGQRSTHYCPQCQKARR